MRRFVGLIICLLSAFVLVSSQKNTSSYGERKYYVKEVEWHLEDIPRSIYQQFQSRSSVLNYTRLFYKMWQSHWSYTVAKKLQAECINIANKTYSAIKKLKPVNLARRPRATKSMSQNIKRNKVFGRLRYFVWNKTIPKIIYLLNTTDYPDTPKIPLPAFVRKPRGFTMVTPGGAQLYTVEILYRRNVPISLAEEDAVQNFGPDLYNGLFNASGDNFVFHDNSMRFFEDDILYVLLFYFFGTEPYFKVLKQRHEINITHYPVRKS